MRLLKPNPQYDGMRRWRILGGWLCQEGGVLINAISALMEETPGYSPVIQWGGLHTPSAKGLRSIPGRGA